MIHDYNLIEFLQEIEKVTDLNGCFFINAKDDIIIESTIPFRVPDEILWEIGVLRDTFRQFSNGINHGDLNELMIEGDKGYVLLYDIPPHLLLLALGSDEMNLSYVRLAMIDILKRAREKIAEIGDDILKLPGKDFGFLGEKEGIAPTVVGAEQPAVSEPLVAKEIVTVEPIEEEPLPSVELEPVQVEQAEDIETMPKATEISPVEASIEPSTEVEAVTPEVSEESIEDRIKSLETKDIEQRYHTLKTIFNELKSLLEQLTGNELGGLLEQLKDGILLNIGTSLALFDISKAEQELSKINRELGIAEIKEFKNRINNWASRIIKL